jgi:hypothetical protein
MRLSCRASLLCLGLAALFSGCAEVVHKPITSAEDKTATGIRYYNASPYVLVYANSGGGITAEVKYLPDPHKLMSAKPNQWLSSLDTTLSFANGVLTQADTTADTTVVPKAILSAAKAAATALLAKTVTPQDVPKPRLFKIVRAKNGEYLLVGGEANVPFKLTK